MKRLTGWARFAMVAVPLTGGAAWAAPDPLVLEAKFLDEVSSRMDLPRKAKRCSVHVQSVIDGRRDKSVVGVYDDRAVYTPENGSAWLLSIVDALKSRGVDVVHSSETAETPPTVEADFTMSTLWVSNTKTNISANAVFKMKASSMSGETIDQIYRGKDSRHSYWSGGKGQLQGAINTALARSLDVMATDLRKICGVKQDS